MGQLDILQCRAVMSTVSCPSWQCINFASNMGLISLRNNSHHRKCIAASLVRGVYILERDRQQNRLGPQALAPPWWESFNFVLNQVLVDEVDHSFFGAIYEFKFHNTYPNYPGRQNPPRFVIAFRGTINKPGNRAQDFKLDLHCIINNLQKSCRFRAGMEATQNIVYNAGPGNVWLAGHSLGSSIALLIGRNMVKNFIHIETYLFNPPFMSPPIERIKNEKLKHGVRFANSVLTAGLAIAVNGGHKPKAPQDDPFMVLSSWVPYLFINPSDPICSEYVGYFEHGEYGENRCWKNWNACYSAFDREHSLGCAWKGFRTSASHSFCISNDEFEPLKKFQGCTWNSSMVEARFAV